MEDNDKTTEKNLDTAQLLAIVFIIISLLEGMVIFFLISNKQTEDGDLSSTNPLSQPVLSTPIPTAVVTPTKQSEMHNVEETYYFPIRSGNTEVGNIKYTIKAYEFTNQVVVNQVYNALVTGDKEILAVHLELENENDAGVQIMAADYIRLNKNGDNKNIAPDIESDPVEVRPHSVKNVSLGFTTKKSDQQLNLIIGELNGEKEIIEAVRQTNRN